MKQNNTEQKNLYDKNVIDVVIVIMLFSYTLLDCMKKWTFI